MNHQAATRVGSRAPAAANQISAVNGVAIVDRLQVCVNGGGPRPRVGPPLTPGRPCDTSELSAVSAEEDSPRELSPSIRRVVVEVHPPLQVQVVDLKSVRPEELAHLWCHAQDIWRHSLLLDASVNLAVLRRLVERQSLQGQALRYGDQIVGYLCYALAGDLAVIVDVAVSPTAISRGAEGLLIQQSSAEIRRHGVRRIESQAISDCGAELAVAFAREGFQTYWHECLRLAMPHVHASVPRPPGVELSPWRKAPSAQLAEVLRTAYSSTIEAEIHERYRTLEGCQEVLESTLDQGSCGTFVEEASAIAHCRGQMIGLIVITAGLPRQAHLPQIAVVPAYQGQGLGRTLLDYSLSRLAALHFETLSLIVCRNNRHATGLYRSRGFKSVLSFPLFVWDR